MEKHRIFLTSIQGVLFMKSFFSLSLLALSSFAFSAHAADVKITMLNSNKAGAAMVFEPAFVKVNVGDTVSFVSGQAGAHNARSLLTPTGAKSFVSEPDKPFTYKVEKEGVYLFVCDPHKVMGMVGVIQVGKPVNLAEAKKFANDEQAKFAMNKDAYTKLLAQVK